ncbi:MAG: flagellar assembly protein FliW [Lachnospiraceae bacterium]|nr:flagellar assembly protein FliW [Lachnospiraceae bacterium]
MEVTTRLFGKIDIADDKIITLENGIIGFPDLRRFTIIFDNEKDEEKSILWFQSMDEPQFAMPVLVPNYIIPDYNPTVNDELLAPLGKLDETNTYVLVTVKVPQRIEDMTINLKAPIIINTDTLLGAQIIVEDEDALVRFPVYEILKAAKEKGGA